MIYLNEKTICRSGSSLASQEQGVVSLVWKFRHHRTRHYVSLDQLQVKIFSTSSEEVEAVHLLVVLEKAEEEILGEGLGDIREVNKIRCRRNRCMGSMCRRNR